MKPIFFLTMIMALLPSISIAATMKGKFLRNLTSHPYSAFKIHVESNVDGGGPEGPFKVNDDGTFKIQTSGFFRQNISVSINGKAYLHITTNGEADAKSKLNSISVIELDEKDASISLTTGEDVDLWMKENLPYGKLDLRIWARNAEFKSTFQQSFPIEITSGKFVIPKHYAIFTSEKAFSSPVELFLDVQTAEIGPGANSAPIQTLSYSGLMGRDVFSSFSSIEISPEFVNTDVTGHWEGQFGFDGKYDYISYSMDLVCSQGVLTGSMTVSSQQIPKEEFNISEGHCNKQDSSFRVTLPFTSGTNREMKEVDLDFVFVSKNGAGIHMLLDNKYLSGSYVGRE